MSTLALTQTTKQRILELLDSLPPESLVMVERFAEFLRQQAGQAQPVATTAAKEPRPYLYPTVEVPASVWDGLIGIMPPVGGDALADTEALYDEV